MIGSGKYYNKKGQIIKEYKFKNGLIMKRSKQI